MNDKLNPGLEGVVVADSHLSYIDGNDGVLVIAGYDIAELAQEHTVEDICALLWTGNLPDADARMNLQQQLASGRRAAFDMLPELGNALIRDDGMSALRASLAQLPEASPAHIVGATATFAAAWWRGRIGEQAIAPDERLDHARDYYRMARGGIADDDAARAMSRYLVTVADHGMNASTFTARTVASTGSDDVSAVVAALGALKGPLHGGAPGPVLDMIGEIATAERAEPWLRERIRNKERIMGMGHRVYRVRDPRAAVFEEAAIELNSGRIELARHIERVAERLLTERHPGRTLRANVEFYTAVLLDALGLAPAQFAPTFAVGRVVGWCAHIAEQRRTGRLIRPRARYVGPTPDRRAAQPSSS